MKIFTFIFLITSSLIVSSQSITDEINEQVWIPFTKAWESNNGKAFNAIHADDVWRINPERLLLGDEYKNRNKEKMQGQPKGQIIEFSFETRIVNGDNAYEVGYYLITRKTDSIQFVGRFHVALKKIDGRWKITQDWDTDVINGIKITPESVKSRKFEHFE